MNTSAARLVKGLNYSLDLDRLHANAHRAFTVLNAHLEGRMFLELERPTIADIACFPYAALAWEGGLDISNYRNMIEWIDRIKKLPHFTSMPGL